MVGHQVLLHLVTGEVAARRMVVRRLVAQLARPDRPGRASMSGVFPEEPALAVNRSKLSWRTVGRFDEEQVSASFELTNRGLNIAGRIGFTDRHQIDGLAWRPQDHLV
jgi:hypothetical protein